jgi:hypothetical protein
MKLIVIIFLLATGIAQSVPPLKVICASYAEQSPAIDGRLDDACWLATEVRSDFSTVADPDKGVKHQTSIRAVYDGKNLYLALEFFWDDIEILKRGVKEILDRQGPPIEGACEWDNYTNYYGAEIFVDPHGTLLNYEQILINAAGQYTGNYKGMWEQFKGIHTVRSFIHDDRWTAELVCPAPGLKVTDVWGLNVVRDNAAPYAIWRHISGAYAQPKLFGRVIMGSYQAWWNAVFAVGVEARLDEIAENLDGQARLLKLHAVVKVEADRVAVVAAEHPPTTRENFEILYHAYDAFEKNMNRLEIAYATYQAMQ